MSTIANTLLHYSQQYKLFPPNDTIIVAVSGGADSLCLLHALQHIQHHLQIEIHVATFDHQTRPPHSARDADYVVQLAHTWHLPVTRAHATDFAPSPPHNEAQARLLRYRFLAQLAHDIHATTIATAHHADDQTETILHRILRGTSLQGLRAIQPISPLPHAPHLRLVRPLLTITRQQILDYCQQHNLQPRHDATNDDSRYTRNRLRHQILPLLHTINPDTARALQRLAHHATLDDDFITQYLQQHILPQLKRPTPHHIHIPLHGFLNWHPALQQRTLVWAFKQFPNHARHELTYNQVENARQILLAGQVGTQAHLTNHLQIRREYHEIIVEPRHLIVTSNPTIFLPPDEQYTCPINHWLEFPTWRMRLSTTQPPDETIPIIIPAQHNSHIILRTRRPGDRFAPPNLQGHHQKLKAWLINQKIPRLHRNTIPLLIIDHEIRAVLLDDAPLIAYQPTPDSHHLTLFLQLQKSPDEYP